MFNALDHLHHTAEGADGLPACFLRLAAPGFSGILAHLINKSLDGAIIPTQWKTAIIRPKAKVPPPNSPADFGPISVLPVLSREVDRFLVRHVLYPSFEAMKPPLLLDEQFAFRSTGSAAVIAILHNVIETDNEHVISLFPRITPKPSIPSRHSPISEALSRLDIPDSIYNWLVEYL